MREAGEEGNGKGTFEAGWGVKEFLQSRISVLVCCYHIDATFVLGDRSRHLKSFLTFYFIFGNSSTQTAFLNN